MHEDEDFPRRGEIWLIDTPNQPDDPHQPRPSLIISVTLRSLKEAASRVTPSYVQRVRLNYGDLAADT